MRIDGKLPDDPLLHACALTFCSDLTLLDCGPGRARRGLGGRAAWWAPAWTTRCGSTARSGPMSGSCTTAPARRRPVPADSPPAGCSQWTAGNIATAVQEGLLRRVGG